MTRRTLLRLAAALLVVACSRSDAPVDPVWGKEPCAHCAMLVSDRRHAAQLVAGGDRKYFDDVGCMAVWLDAHHAEPEHAWVRGAEGEGWNDARTARFASGARTPMDFGFEASATGTLTWSDVRARSVERERSPR